MRIFNLFFFSSNSQVLVSKQRRVCECSHQQKKITISLQFEEQRQRWWWWLFFDRFRDNNFFDTLAILICLIPFTPSSRSFRWKDKLCQYYLIEILVSLFNYSIGYQLILLWKSDKCVCMCALSNNKDENSHRMDALTMTTGLNASRRRREEKNIFSSYCLDRRWWFSSVWFCIPIMLMITNNNREVLICQWGQRSCEKR